jgi:integrase
LKIRDKGYTARTFRKTFITLARSRYSMDATIVKELVGHEHTNTTDRYYNSVTMDAMKSELAKFKRPAEEQSN